MCQNQKKPFFVLQSYFKYFCAHSNITFSSKKSIKETKYKNIK